MNLVRLILASFCVLRLTPATYAVDDQLAGTVVITLRAEDPVLEGHGPARKIEHTADFSGTLFLWTSAKELDGFLHVEDGDGKLLGEDDDSGGGTTPFLTLDVEPEMKFVITVAASKQNGSGDCVLHLIRAPETEGTRAAADKAMAARDEVEALRRTGELARARTILSHAVVELLASKAAASSAQVARAAWKLGFAAHDLSDPKTAGTALRLACEFRSRALPQDHPDLQKARQNLAITLHALGDLAAARELFEKVLAVRSRLLPEDDPDLQWARANLANAMASLGDPRGARELDEKVLEVRSRTLAEDHPDLQSARQNLAATMASLGDLATARGLFEKVLEVDSRTLSEDDPALQAARMNLATVMNDQGELVGARELEEKVLEVRSRTLPEDHPDLQSTRGNLANTLAVIGDLHGARELEEKILEVFERTLPEDHPAIEKARGYLLWTYVCLGAEREALDVARRLDSGLGASIAGSFGKYSPRELEERVDAGRGHLSSLLSIARGAGVFEANPALDRRTFARLESSRSVGLLGAWIEPRGREDAALASLREEEARRSSELAGLAQTGASRDDLAAARAELDRLKRERLAHLAADPASKALLEEPSADALASKLAADEAIVGYWRYTRSEVASAENCTTNVSECLLANVLRHDGKLVRVELGPIEDIHNAVSAWRDALKSPIERGEKVDHPASIDSARASGEMVRMLVFDPLLPALEGARRLVVAQDDELHAVPLEALPLDEGVLGEYYSIELHLILRELLWPPGNVFANGALVALGGPSFNSQPEGWQEPPTVARAVSASAQSPAGPPKNGDLRGQEEEPAIASSHEAPAPLRGTVWARGFPPLTHTGDEARGMAALYEESIEQHVQAIVLEKKQASRAALEALAPRARYLHLATHGWFAPESMPSIADLKPIDSQLGLAMPMSREEQVRGLSPMLLCGLALAGANLEKDEFGRIPGIITAEEIASFDLSNCELAVLSACDTDVGVRRAGQGVASLQKALHMAGARTVITSLWKVPDEATKELMLDFYRRLWIEKKPKHQALWEAKMKLRAKKDEQGKPLYSTRDWAAWVLTGDPN